MSRRTFGAALLCALSGCATVLDLDEIVPETHHLYLAFDNRASKSALPGLPVLVILEPTVVPYTFIDDPARDLRFHDPQTAADLPFEVERWDRGGASILWVLVPEIDARSNTDYIELFAGPEARNTAGADVWGGYDAVLHADGDLGDSAGSDNNGTLDGAALGDGAVGGGIRLAGGEENQVVTLANSQSLLASWPQFSFELWLYADYPDLSHCQYPAGETRSPEPQFMSMVQTLPSDPPTLTGGRLFCISQEGPMLAQVDTHTTGTTFYAPSYISMREWTHLVYSYDGRYLWVYRNGDYDSVSDGAAATSKPAQGPIYFGSDNNPIRGNLDEIRFSRSHRSLDWAYANYLSQANRFVTFSEMPPVSTP